MTKLLPAPGALFAAVLIFSGCSNQSGSFLHNKTVQPAPAAAPVTASPAPHAAVPYVLSAQSTGAFIEFSIYNLGATDLPVQPENFALVSTDAREVTPYSRDTAVVDLPQPAVVKPNETLKGRAIFKQVNNPMGKRLVFKPDATGTFADINAPSAVR